MKQAFSQYWGVYKHFFKTCVAEATSYRLNFTLLILMDILFYFTSLQSVSFIYDHVEQIGPWNKPQLMFFISYMLTLDQIHMTFVSGNFWMLSHEIRTGGLDFILLKPLNSVFSVFFRHIRVSSLVNFITVWVILYYYGSQIPLSFVDWLLVPLFILLSLALLVLMEICLITSTFWLTEGWGINFLRMQFQQMARWPYFVFSGYTQKFFLVAAPILLIGSSPVQYLYDKSKINWLLALILAITFFWFLHRILWKIGLRKYDSASS